MESKLTVIIPVRARENCGEILARLDYSLEDNISSSCVNFLVVDDGSPQVVSQQIQKKCQKNGFDYLRTQTESAPFSIARSRNIAAMHASSDFIMFQDVDLVPYPGFYHDALNEICIQGLEWNSELFVMFGVVYLTEAATGEFFQTAMELRKETFLHRVYLGDCNSIVKTSTGTSVTIFNREYYLARGGNSEDFYEWGFEDHEFACRCLQRVAIFPMPEEFLKHYCNFENITQYKGWKAPYRLFGDMTFQKGKVLFHAWHPVETKSEYHRAKNRNERLFDVKMAAYARQGAKVEPDPLPSLCEGRSLVFSNTNPFIYNRDTLPRLGEVFVEDEKSLTARGLVEYVRQHDISRILFHNPYANRHRLVLYKTARKFKIPYVVAERGALPGSVFFDPNGFLADSCSYAAEKWDFPLTTERRRAVEAYIRQERKSDHAMEAQGQRLEVEVLRNNLGLKPEQKVLFVPLQRPADTVIKYQCGPVGTFNDFIRLVGEVCCKIGTDWAVIVKKHPLEDERPEIPGATYADEAHVKDLLDISDAVLLINSGVGVLSMIWEKPVYYAGAVWYGHPDINRQVLSADDMAMALQERFRPSQEMVARFLSYLLHDFYSFGHFATQEDVWREGGRMTITTGIDFYQIRGLGRTPFNARAEKLPIVPGNSILFDRYRTSGLRIKEDHTLSGSSYVVHPLNNSPLHKKLKKLRSNPRRFFAESHYWVLRMAGRFVYGFLLSGND